MTPDVVSVALAAFAASLLSLFSGFGLGTLLLPVFALFLPVEIAVASTAVVHAANNLFKVGLLASGARRDVVVRFGVPAVAASFVGAALLTQLSTGAPLASWTFLGRDAAVTPIKLVMGALIVAFALFELVPALARIEVAPRWLPLGGALSGFFGGLSGHQGALRAMFLTPLRLSPTEFASTQAVLALFVDAARLVVYGFAFVAFRGAAERSAIPWPLVGLACVCAFGGALLGKRLLPKMTVESLRLVVGALLLVVGVVLGTGIA